MNSTIKKALKNSISYEEYRELMQRLVDENETTGPEQTESFINYTQLNHRRMKRWDKTVKIDDSVKKRLNHFNESATWLVITESWCGDAAHVMPVMHKVAELNPNINFRVVFRDEHDELMNLFLTNGTRSIPKLIMIDNTTEEVIETYGPRPSQATRMVNKYKEKHGKLSPEFKEDLQHWYNKDKGQNIIEDLTTMLCKLDATVCQ
jgi:thiol-disulfide isomerase/thioredoxin